MSVALEVGTSRNTAIATGLLAKTLYRVQHEEAFVVESREGSISARMLAQPNIARLWEGQYKKFKD